MYKKKELLEKIFNIFKKHKFGSKEAKISAEVIINAELVGAPSHGVSRLKMYCDRIKKELINPKPKIKIKKISKSISPNLGPKFFSNFTFCPRPYGNIKISENITAPSNPNLLIG